MVTLAQVQQSNALVAKSLPATLTAVFVGGTNGIGETTLKQFAKHVPHPRAYFIGRSQEAADRITAQCKKLNDKGEYIFIKADTGLLATVDEVCNSIKQKEQSINLLVLSTGTLVPGIETSEGLHLATSLAYYSRTRFILNLLPLLKQATGLRRVVSVFTGTKEGPIITSDFQGSKNVPLLKQRGHASSMVTLSLEIMSQEAPEVSFIHDFPGPVKSGIARGTTGALFGIMKVLFAVLGPFIYIANQESGERHLFCSTSAKYPSKERQNESAGVPLGTGVSLARGTDGIPGSGVYSIDWDGESASQKTEQFISTLRTDGTAKKLWDHTLTEMNRITGTKSIWE